MPLAHADPPIDVPNGSVQKDGEKRPARDHLEKRTILQDANQTERQRVFVALKKGLIHATTDQTFIGTAVLPGSPN
jgi:hypothetical protein